MLKAYIIYCKICQKQVSLLITLHELTSPKGTVVMRILVIGGTNFMGPLVVRFLSEQGNEVTVVHGGQTRTDLPREVKELLGDRRPPANSAAELQRMAPEVVPGRTPAAEHDPRAVSCSVR